MEYPHKIISVKGREIIDSRGNPTVEAVVRLAGGATGRAAVPSGASTGFYEAHELRDGDKKRYLGKGVLTAVENINRVIAAELTGMDATNIASIDRAMLSLDDSENKSKLGANAVLAVSLACARAASYSLGLPLYRFIGGINPCVLPTPMMNILNGGAHADNNVDIQEFMIVPIGAVSFSQAVRQCVEVFHTLKSILKSRGLSTAVGDEGGYAPSLGSDEQALELITEAIEAAGYETGVDFAFALDAAASEWRRPDGYVLPKNGASFDTAGLIEHWKTLCDQFPIISIEDALSEDDWEGWTQLTQVLGERIQLVGDDLFATNTQRLKNGIAKGSANSILIKLNQIGSLTETLDAVNTAYRAGYTAIISHRSGETEDSFIADLAVALNAGQIKTGAPSRSDRVAKYNQLLRIEEQLGENAVYLGGKAFKQI